MSSINELKDLKKQRSRKIRAMLVERGITLTSIARSLGLTPATVGDVVTGGRQSRRVKLAVARTLRMRPRDLWPDDAWPENNNRHAA